MPQGAAGIGEKMSRKEYVTMASDLATDWKYAQAHGKVAMDTFDMVFDTLCYALKRDNSAFDRDKFRVAVKGA
jgi:hypothetical protein